ncbi:histidinol dehydrogenase [Microbacterium sp. SA39]|uniref:histidinol dehydrogenase n=1 Tax=Microbacterium sp. SA39 TaxID=1263625 RepID=UPI001F487642|nr:histidinol dehydrogenase [Microbacterium sp. SA39]
MARAHAGDSSVETTVADIITRIREDGFAAASAYAHDFDGVELDRLRVSAQTIRDAADSLPAETLDALSTAIDRTRTFAEAQRPETVTTTFPGGATVSLLWEPVSRAGVYVPGGKAVYPSSVIMNVVPAQAAGVTSIALASPPQREYGGMPHPHILAAAHLLGIDEVYAIGGAQAIAALAFGIDDPDPERALPAVDVITGPGNIYVATAKRLVRGHVAVDAEAGATEVMILADSLADPATIAVDMICQAEHDENAAAVLVTPSASLLGAVSAELRRRAPTAAHRERVAAALGGPQSALVLVDDIGHGIRFCSAYAPEHLEVHCENADAVAAQVTGAGAVFVGATTPVSLGDYTAGSNHVLPTGGTASFSSGLSVYSFLRNVQNVAYPLDALRPLRDTVRALSTAENLPAHGAAFDMRFAASDRASS